MFRYTAQPLNHAQKPAVSAPNAADDDPAETQNKLMSLLRLTPTLTEVVAHDPSLLADQAYISHKNPELAKFLQTHPEAARNPEFYRFSGFGQGARRRGLLLLL